MSYIIEEAKLFKNINKLPQVLVDIINSYIPYNIKVLLNKSYYIKYHKEIRKYIDRRQIENYIRTMVRQDNNFVFNYLLVENYRKWLNMKNYYYKSSIYGNYLCFLESYCIENESDKCKELIKKKLEELGLSKNQHKKNTIKYIRWRT